jgi:hypothetical protein
MNRGVITVTPLMVAAFDDYTLLYSLGVQLLIRTVHFSTKICSHGPSPNQSTKAS